MDEAEARERIERGVAASTPPELTDEEVDDLVLLARRTDPDGIGPDDTGWTPTWDLDAAISEGYRWKAAKASGDYDFSADGASFSRSQRVAGLLKLAGAYGKTGGAGEASGPGRIGSSRFSTGPDDPGLAALGNWSP